MTRARLDTLLVEQGLAASRERARALILAGQVTVDGAVASKAGTPVAAGAVLALRQPDHPYVGRGGVKLAHALDAFGVPVEGREALDIGASTGGFTDVLLRRGAARVVAYDVGRGQLDWSLRTDPRVVVIEGRNARSLALADLPGPADVVTIDVSFISLAHDPAARGRRAAAGRRRRGAREAAVRSGARRGRQEGARARPRGARARDRPRHRAAAAAGLARVGLTPSPITGTTGQPGVLPPPEGRTGHRAGRARCA